MTLNGYLMSKDDVTAKIEDGIITPIHSELLPLYFQREDSSVHGWLKSRAINSQRPNSRLLKKTFGYSDLSDVELVLEMSASTITDTYWIKSENSKLSWADVQFVKNDFSNIALLGSFSDSGKAISRTPEFTNTGSFEKCWRNENDTWWLYKLGFQDNLFSEMTAFELCKHFQYDTAYYEIVESAEHFIGRIRDGQGVIRTKDFTNSASVNFEPAFALGLSSDNVSKNYETFKKISEEIAFDYLSILTMDVLVFNLDRHNQNFGVLRDVQSGEIMKLAPNFDNNLSFLAGIHGMDKRTEDSDLLFKEWKNVIQGNIISLELPPLNKNELLDILYNIPCDINSEEIEHGANFIMAGYEMMENTLHQIHKFYSGFDSPTM